MSICGFVTIKIGFSLDAYGLVMSTVNGRKKLVSFAIDCVADWVG